MRVYLCIHMYLSCMQQHLSRQSLLSMSYHLLELSSVMHIHCQSLQTTYKHGCGCTYDLIDTIHHPHPRSFSIQKERETEPK